MESTFTKNLYKQQIRDFYKRRLDYFMCNIGNRTEYNTLITPTLVKVTLKRYLQLGGEVNDVN